MHTAIGDLLEVTNYLLDLGKTDIHNLGLTLGLHYPHLTKMGGSDTFRDDMIAAWLQKEDQVLKQGVPSWKTLVKALRNPRVNQTGVAERIEITKRLQCDMHAGGETLVATYTNAHPVNMQKL